MFKLTLIIALIAFGISKYNEKYNCTDDGCPDFYDEIEVPLPDENIRGDLREIEKDWKHPIKKSKIHDLIGKLDNSSLYSIKQI